MAAYLNLTDADRQQFEQFLALQVYGDPETTSYLHVVCAKYVVDSQRVLLTQERCAIYGAWAIWDREVKRSHLAHVHHREAIKDMLSALIQYKTESPLSETVLRAAAETAMFWARWDEVYLGQLRNSGTKTTAAYNAELAELALAKHCDGDTLGSMARWM
jgi:hypothetical protein